MQTYVTASIRWLAKRVPQFLHDHPEVKLTLSTCAVDWDFDDVHADVGLVYCEEVPNPAKYHWEPLFDYALYPVCSPDLLSRMAQPVTIDALMSSRWSPFIPRFRIGRLGSIQRAVGSSPRCRS